MQLEPSGPPSLLRSQQAPLTAPGAPRPRAGSALWARLLLLSLFLHLPGAGLLPVAMILAVPYLGVAIRNADQPRQLRYLAASTLASLVCGLLLTLRLTTGDAPLVLTQLQAAAWLSAFPILSIAGGFAISLLGLRKAVVWIAAGSLLGAVTYYGLAGNTWKYSLAYPVSLTALYLAGRLGRAYVYLVGTCLVGICVAYSARSAALEVLLALMLLALPTYVFARRRAILPLAAVGVLIWVSVLGASNAMEQGLLGDDLKQTYEIQTRGDRNLIAGGRLELSAARVLAHEEPLGYGLGARVPSGVQREALAAVRATGGDADAGYYSIRVFGPRTDLHSIAATLWFHGGLFGAVTALLALGLLLSGIARLVAARSAVAAPVKAACYFALVTAAWDMLFSPMLQIDRVGIGLAIAVGVLILLPVSTRDGRCGTPSTASPHPTA